MKRYPAWQAIYRSFYSMDFYRDVAEHWGEVGYVYLFLLAGLYWAIATLVFQLAMAGAINDKLLPLASQMPELKVVDGKFQIDKKSPYSMKYDGRDLFIFDTTGQTQQLDQPGMLITDTQMIAYTGAQVTTSKTDSNADSSTTSTSTTDSSSKVLAKASDMEGMKVDAATLRYWIEMVRNYFWMVLLGFGWFSGTMFLWTLGLVYGVLGLIFNSINQSQLKFSQLMRLAAVAITPPLVLETLIKFPYQLATSKQVPAIITGGLGFIATMVYMYMGTRASKPVPIVTVPPSSIPPADNPPLS